jgi:hypothetical protein
MIVTIGIADYLLDQHVYFQEQLLNMVFPVPYEDHCMLDSLIQFGIAFGMCSHHYTLAYL